MIFNKNTRIKHQERYSGSLSLGTIVLPGLPVSHPGFFEDLVSEDSYRIRNWNKSGFRFPSLWFLCSCPSLATILFVLEITTKIDFFAEFYIITIRVIQKINRAVGSCHLFRTVETGVVSPPVTVTLMVRSLYPYFVSLIS